MDKELEELKIKAAGWHFASEYTPDEFVPGEGWSDVKCWCSAMMRCTGYAGIALKQMSG